MLFSEPKIPQYRDACLPGAPARRVSVLFSEPKIPQSQRSAGTDGMACAFQCSSASRKFLNLLSTRRLSAPASVSVLFSEPKIPQFYSGAPWPARRVFQCSSASRKFLNLSSVRVWRRRTNVSVLFSEPKIPQSDDAPVIFRPPRGFSALQRAENSSMINSLIDIWNGWSFSALQRAENSSIQPLRAATI